MYNVPIIKETLRQSFGVILVSKTRLENYVELN